jgi:anti-anti-sigma factor
MAHSRLPQLTLALREHRDVVIVDVVGRLTVESSADRQLVRTIQRLVYSGRRQFILNLGGVRQIDTAGLTELVESLTTAMRHGGQIKITAVTRHVDELLHVTGLARVFDIYQVESEAIATTGRGT